MMEIDVDIYDFSTDIEVRLIRGQGEYDLKGKEPSSIRHNNIDYKLTRMDWMELRNKVREYEPPLLAMPMYFAVKPKGNVYFYPIPSQDFLLICKPPKKVADKTALPYDPGDAVIEREHAVIAVCRALSHRMVDDYDRAVLLRFADDAEMLVKIMQRVRQLTTLGMSKQEALETAQKERKD